MSPMDHYYHVKWDDNVIGVHSIKTNWHQLSHRLNEDEEF